jgi:hypothetical protein
VTTLDLAAAGLLICIIAYGAAWAHPVSRPFARAIGPWLVAAFFAAFGAVVAVLALGRPRGRHLPPIQPAPPPPLPPTPDRTVSVRRRRADAVAAEARMEVEATDDPVAAMRAAREKARPKPAPERTSKPEAK